MYPHVRKHKNTHSGYYFWSVGCSYTKTRMASRRPRDREMKMMKTVSVILTKRRAFFMSAFSIYHEQTWHTLKLSGRCTHIHSSQPFIGRLDCWFLIGLAACAYLILVLLPSVFSSLSELIKKSPPVNTLPDRYHCLINSHTQTHMS